MKELRQHHQKLIFLKSQIDKFIEENGPKKEIRFWTILYKKELNNAEK